MDVMTRSAPPTLAAGSQLHFDQTLCAEANADYAVEALHCRRHKDAAAIGERRVNLGAADSLGKMRRANFFLPLSDQHEVDREFASGAADRVQCGQQGR